MKTMLVALTMLFTSSLAFSQSGSGIYYAWLIDEEIQKMLEPEQVPEDLKMKAFDALGSGAIKVVDSKADSKDLQIDASKALESAATEVIDSTIEEKISIEVKEWGSFRDDCNMTPVEKNISGGRIETWHFNGVEWKKW